MPELPEVETTRRGIQSHLEQQVIIEVVVRETRLRWLIQPDLPQILGGATIHSVTRRGKYLLFTVTHPPHPGGTLLIHLGMSGNLRIVTADQALQKHDHVDWVLSNQKILRYHDPRRFGAVLWTAQPPERHTLLATLGPEPLTDAFNGDYLYQRSRTQHTAIKTWIMNSHQVVGVGNIYANEALFLAGIQPQHAANSLSLAACHRLADSIKTVLSQAIQQGGTTLRDFVNGEGKPGYFQQSLQVYGRAQQPCSACASPIQQVQLNQRATYFCPQCQS